MSNCSYPSCMMGGMGCDRESLCDEEVTNGSASLTKIKDLEEKLAKEKAISEKLETNLSVCKNDYWFMINLIEKYSTDKDQTLKDCLERMKFRKPLFNVLKEGKEI